MSGTLGSCPECGQPWPDDDDHALRGMGWLGALPRGITPSNGDLFFHDGVHGRDRFLLIETKGPWERWPMLPGQASLLRACAGQRDWTVRVLRGTTHHPTIHLVSRSSIDETGSPVALDAVDVAIAAFLDGAPWTDPVATGDAMADQATASVGAEAGVLIGSPSGWMRRASCGSQPPPGYPPGPCDRTGPHTLHGNGLWTWFDERA